MVKLFDPRDFWNRLRLSSRIPALPKRFAIPKRDARPASPAFRKKLIGGMLVVSGGLCALWASGLCEEAALRAFERQHRPTERVWTSALATRDFQKLQDSSTLQKVSKNLPYNIDASASSWMSPDGLWLAVFLDPNQAVPEAIYCFECKAPFPESWEPLGHAWDGFDQALGRLDQSVDQRHHANVEHRAWRDPREIQY
jgi:hypothetical protein